MPAVPQSDLVILADAAVGVSLDVPPYAGQQAGDRITLTARLVLGGHDDNETCISTLTRSTLVVAEEVGRVAFVLHWADLLPPAPHAGKMHAHISYQVTGPDGNRSAPADELQLRIDTRFADDWLDSTRVPSLNAARLVFEDAALAPALPGDQPDQLLLASRAGTAITVTLPQVPDGFEAGDQVQLLLAEGDGPLEDITDNEGTLCAVMTIPPSATHQPGIHPIGYRLRAASGATRLGPPGQFYTVDTLPPGGHQPGALESLVHLAEGIALDRFPNGIPFGLHGYEGMALGDTIWLVVDGAAVGEPWVINDVTSVEPTKISVPADLFAAHDGEHQLGYVIHDRAGNLPARSALLSFETIRDGIGNLPELRVPGAVDGLIDDADVHDKGGAIVAIPFIAAAREGDAVVIHWARRSVGPLPLTNVTHDDEDALLASVPYGEIYDEWFTASHASDVAVNASVHYDVIRGHMRAGTSPVTNLVVNLFVAGAGGAKDPEPALPSRDALQPPVVQAADEGTDVISAVAHDQPARVRIPARTAVSHGLLHYLRKGDVLSACFDGKTLAPYVVDDADGDSDEIMLTLPAEQIAGSAGAVPVTYTVTRAIEGGEGNAMSPVKTVRVYDPAEAPGGGKGLEPPRWVNHESGKDPGTIYLLDALHALTFEIPPYDNKREGDSIKLVCIVRSENGSPLRETTRWITLGVPHMMETPATYIILRNLLPWSGADAPMSVEAFYQLLAVGGASSQTSASAIFAMDLSGIDDIIGDAD